MVVICQLHVPGCFTVEETAPETHPLREWVGPRLHKKNSILPVFHHLFLFFWNHSFSFYSIKSRWSPYSSWATVWKIRYSIPGRIKSFFLSSQMSIPGQGPTSLQFDGHLGFLYPGI